MENKNVSAISYTVPPILYWYNFTDTAGNLYKVEIRDIEASQTNPPNIEIQPGNNPFIIEYEDIDKLEPIQGSIATMQVIDDTQQTSSNYGFKYTDLHTTNPVRFQVILKSVISGVEKKLWAGFLVTELYNENLDDANNYTVELRAHDFGVLKKFKYNRKKTGSEYLFSNGILYQELYRLFSVFQGELDLDNRWTSSLTPDYCLSTSTGDFIDGASVFFKLKVNIENFYDEDGEPMNCYEVLDSILRPFALTCIQTVNGIFIYDYNSIVAVDSSGLIETKRVTVTNSAFHIDSATIDVGGKNTYNVGQADKSGSFTFDDSINNVELESSIYASAEAFDFDFNGDDFTGDHTAEIPIPANSNNAFLVRYKECKGYVEGLNYSFGNSPTYDTQDGRQFHYYQEPITGNTISGLRLCGRWGGSGDAPKVAGNDHQFAAALTLKSSDDFTPDPNISKMIFGAEFFMWYNGSKDADGGKDIFQTPYSEAKGNQWPSSVMIPSTISITDGSQIYYLYVKQTHHDAEPGRGGDPAYNRWEYVWATSMTGYLTSTIYLCFSAQISDLTNIDYSKISSSTSGAAAASKFIHDRWCKMVLKAGSFGGNLLYTYNAAGEGIEIPQPPISGKITISISSMAYVGEHFQNPDSTNMDNNRLYYCYLNKIRMLLKDRLGRTISTENSLFQSYIDPNAKSDYKRTLNVVSVVKKDVAVGRANVRDITTNMPVSQFSRGLETNVFLEELLLCTVHSNFTGKFQKFEVTINSNRNGDLETSVINKCTPLIEGFFWMQGAEIDIKNNKRRLSLIRISNDNKSLSNTAYGQ